MPLPPLKGLGVEQIKSPPPVAKTPFAATKTGVAVNTVKGLPKAAWDISKWVSDTLTNLPGNTLRTANNFSRDITNAVLPESKRQFGEIGTPGVLNVIPGFKDEPSRPLSVTAARYTDKLESKGFGKLSVPLGVVGAVAPAAFDFSPGGSAEKNIVKKVAPKLLRVAEDTLTILKNLSSKELAVGGKIDIEAMNLIDNFATKIDNGTVVQKDITEAQKLHKLLKPEAVPLPVPKKSLDGELMDQLNITTKSSNTMAPISKTSERIIPESIPQKGFMDKLKDWAQKKPDNMEGGFARNPFVRKDDPVSSIEAASKAEGMASTELAQSTPKVSGTEALQQPLDIVPPGGVEKSLPTSVPIQPAKSIGEEVSGAIQRLQNAIAESKPARAKLEATYTAERAKRAQALQELQQAGPEGKAGYYEQLKALKGELASDEKKMFDVADNIVEQDIKSLFKAAKLNPALDVYDKLNTQTALMKVLDGRIPTNSEISLLEKTYGTKLVEEIMKKRTTGQKLLEGIQQIVNLPRAVMSSFDMSAPFRQGLALISHPKAFFNSFAGMFKQFGSEKAFKAVQESIAAMPEYPLMKQGKLALTDVGTILSNREEKFMSSWAEKIPAFGSVIKASNRAYVGFLNKLRADVFTDIIKGVRAGGNELDEKLVKEIASFVNTASGRGEKIFGVPIGNAGTFLNGIFFSPRLMASRITMLNPVSYISASPVVRKEMFKSLFTVLGSGMTVLGLAKMAGADIGTDSNSSDFGKIKIGNTRIDIWGGFQQYIRMASQLISNKYVSTTGRVTTLGEGYKPLTRYDIAMRQIESKEAPVLSFITAMLKQQDYKGQPVKVTEEIAKRFVPMVIGDLYDLAKESPELIPVGLLSPFGFGVQSYQPPTYSKSNKGMPGIKSSPLKQSSGGLKGLKGVGL